MARIYLQGGEADIVTKAAARKLKRGIITQEEYDEILRRDAGWRREQQSNLPRSRIEPLQYDGQEPDEERGRLGGPPMPSVPCEESAALYRVEELLRSAQTTHDFDGTASRKDEAIEAAISMVGKQYEDYQARLAAFKAAQRAAWRPSQKGSTWTDTFDETRNALSASCEQLKAALGRYDALVDAELTETTVKSHVVRPGASTDAPVSNAPRATRYSDQHDVTPLQSGDHYILHDPQTASLGGSRNRNSGRRTSRPRRSTAPQRRRVRSAKRVPTRKTRRRKARRSRRRRTRTYRRLRPRT